MSLFIIYMHMHTLHGYKIIVYLTGLPVQTGTEQILSAE